MKILGHKSAGMSMTYANISDPVVLADYQSVVQPGAVIAGPLADTLRAGQLGQDALDWLKANFYKTELELGHCLRLPRKARANAIFTSHALNSSPLSSTRRGCANGSALSASLSATPQNAAGPARRSVTTGPSRGSSRCSMNWANRTK